MFEILLDVINGQADYSMIIWIFIGLSFQFIWIFKNEVKYVQNFHSISDIQLIEHSPLLLNSISYDDKRFLWIIKIIRRKNNRDEEPVISISYPII